MPGIKLPGAQLLFNWILLQLGQGCGCRREINKGDFISQTQPSSLQGSSPAPTSPQRPSTSHPRSLSASGRTALTVARVPRSPEGSSLTAPVPRHQEPPHQQQKWGGSQRRLPRNPDLSIVTASSGGEIYAPAKPNRKGGGGKKKDLYWSIRQRGEEHALGRGAGRRTPVYT